MINLRKAVSALYLQTHLPNACLAGFMRIGPGLTTGVAALALGGFALGGLALSATSVAAQSAYVAVDGGLSCARGKTVEDIGGAELGDDGCGGRGGIEVGRTGAPVFSVFDHWALRGRFSQTKDKESFVLGASGGDASFDERRTTLDAEIGARTPFSMFGGVSRVTLGLRFAGWDGDLKATATSGPDAGTVGQIKLETTGFGPRIGFRSSIPLGTHFMYESAMGLSALFSRTKGQMFENGVLMGDGSGSGTVFSFDSMSLLSYKLNGKDTGPVISIGIASDYYFNQVPTDSSLTSSDKVNRYSFGPVARFRMPLQ
jgi:hypothetical protein